MTNAENTITGHSRTDARELARVLLQDTRVGWEYVDPGAAVPSPLLGRRPSEPIVPPPVRPPQPASASPSAGRWVAVVLVTLVGLSSATQSPVLLLVALGVDAAMLGPWLAGRRREDQVTRSWQDNVAAAQRQHAQRLDAWQRQVGEHDSRERHRLSVVPLWYPVRLTPSDQRIDVVGGTLQGWQHLLVTLVTGMLREERRVLVLDLSETDGRMVGPLAEVVQTQVRVRQETFPGGGLDPFGTLSADQLADTMSDSLNTLRDAPDEAARAGDAEILGVALRRLARPLTVPRLAAALRVLERGRDDAGVLTEDEEVGLAADVDAVGTSDRVVERIHVLRVALEMLLDDEPGVGGAGVPLMQLWEGVDVATVGTHGGSRRRKDLRDAVLFHGVLTALREHRGDLSGRALVVLGADGLEGWALEDMARQAERRGVRLVLFMEHLRDQVERLVGTSGSATVFMRLGNGKEAAAAAEHIGRGHSFVLSQITKQMGVTNTVGAGRSTATTETLGESKQAGTSTAGLLHSSASESTSFTESVGRTASEMSNWSQAVSESESLGEQRVYEFTVEPVELQQLPPTAFFLVEGSRGGQRAVLGDCHVSIALQERVADRASAAQG